MKSARRKKATSKLLTVWVSEELLPLLDKGVRKDDSDRSKFIRKAIREKLTRQGVLSKNRQ
ncbi:MAG TPA: ribbon-helix-helix protein, CopG family [Verrucomicrobiae bacterium]|nr:ribbon-helix-helix protein, CopG family [Verrucomicrobiae bacterium]